MTYIQILGLSMMLCLSLITSCTCNKEGIVYDRLTEHHEEMKDHYFKDYCNNLLNLDTEESEILSSFIGNHKEASLLAARKNEKYLVDILLEQDKMKNEDIKKYFNEQLIKYEAGTDERIVFERFLNVLDRPKHVKDLFEEYSIEEAKPYIVRQAQNFHFTVINESHYSGQNRAFTKELLKPLWDIGYRYLALETFSSGDTLLSDLKYPSRNKGYYLNESNMGNLVREALSIGYKLIQYDVPVNGHLELLERENLRDQAQAENIYNRTLKKDAVGKVLIHSGYDHQIEFSMNEIQEFMGKSLKKISKQDILTINQNVMMEKKAKENDYYDFAKQYIRTPSVFINKKSNECLVDPIKYVGGIDIQVYHPETRYIEGRPNWMLSNKKLYSLPKKVKEKYIDCLLSIRPEGEPYDSTPIDQFVIGDEKKIILSKGEYVISIMDCNLVLKATIPTTVH